MSRRMAPSFSSGGLIATFPEKHGKSLRSRQAGQAARARGRGPYPDLTDEEMRAGLDQLPTWALEQKTAANRQVIAIMGGRLERGEPMQRMYGPLGLAWLQRQADIADQLIRACRQPSP
jgi:hypothetical protein